MFEERREFAARRQPIIAANPELQERELIKLASLAGGGRRGAARAAASATRPRSSPPRPAITVFRVAFERWVDPANTQDLRHLILGSLDDLRAVTAPSVAAAPLALP